MKICGTDEAGRGPLIGPMVMCGVMVDDSKEKQFVELGVKDSKLLTPEQRERMFEKIKEIADDFEIIILTPADIDDALNSPDLNLNWLEAEATAKILDKLKADKAFIDCPSNNVSAYKEYLANKMKTKTELVVEHKADVNYPVAAAASILAKVTRDREIVKLKKEYGEVGSGYPADPITQEFLKQNWNRHPKIFRRTWASYKKIVKEQGQKGLNEF
ncbi:ribonuclease HII [Thermoproteota archaeon]